MAPMRVCPRLIRWSVTARPPAQFVAPTLGRSGSGRLTGSTTTSGMPSSRTWRSWGMVSSEVTRITPSVSWLASALVQLAGLALPWRTAETVAPMECAEHQSSTPRRISTAHGLSSPLKMRSISPVRRRRRSPGRWYLRSPSNRSTRARVSGATSGRPLTTLDTVGSETPASAAIAARVGWRLRFARPAGPALAGSVVDTFVTAPRKAAPGT